MRLALLLLSGVLFAQPPGVVIDHWPAAGGQYVGSPGIAVLSDGTYAAKMDLFGPKSTEKTSAVTRVFASKDRGRTWRHLTDVKGMYWASIFTHRGKLYLMGVEKQYGNVLIRRSEDGGNAWTEPKDEHTGILAEGTYHTAPVPVVIHKGRLWRTMEDNLGPDGWGSHFRALMMSAPEDADLLKRKNWTLSNALGRNPSWLGGDFGGWLEGNAVITRDGKVADILRVDCTKGGKAAVLQVKKNGRKVTFNPKKDFIDLPGGAKKFTIRWDEKTKRYWSLSNWIPPKHAGPRAGTVRNTLALISSPDLRSWTVHTVVLYHPDVKNHAFQYVDWLIEGEDLIAVSRTAFDDGQGGAHNNHDANFLTFHRIEGFRKLSWEQSAVPRADLEKD